MESNKLTVFVCSDENYAPFVATTAASMCDNTKCHIDLRVIDGGISDSTKQKVESIKEKWTNLDISWERVDLENYFKDFPTSGHISKAAYGRLLLPNLFPEIDCAIYSDVDVIYCGDISSINQINLEGYPLAAVPASQRRKAHKIQANMARLGLSDKHRYFESGFLVMDFDQWRRKDIFNGLLKLEEKLSDRLLQMDQDLLNCYFECNYKELPEIYSVTSPRARRFIDNFGNMRNCVIRHFEGSLKPWLIHPLKIGRFKSNYMGKDLFWKYARQTPFYGQLIQRFPIYSKLVSWRLL